MWQVLPFRFHSCRVCSPAPLLSSDGFLAFSFIGLLLRAVTRGGVPDADRPPDILVLLTNFWALIDNVFVLVKVKVKLALSPAMKARMVVEV